MDEKKHCLRCNRLIDASARLCPYCNLDQSSPTAAPRAEAIPPRPPPPVIKPKGEGRVWTKRALIAVGVVALLIGTFVVGGLVIGRGRRAEQAASRNPAVSSTISSQSAQEPVTDLTLVPVSELSSTIGRSMTSAPAPSPDAKVPEELQRSDATALPSTEYSRIVQEHRAAAPKPKEVVVDPRTVRPPAEPSTAASLPKSESSRQSTEERDEPSSEPDRQDEEQPSTRSRDRGYTNPVPTYQPLPRIKNRSKEIKQDGTISLRLTIGTDGRVKEVDVLESLPGVTGKVIAAVQQWKFKPATRNGIPVEGSFPVDISFKSGNDEND